MIRMTSVLLMAGLLTACGGSGSNIIADGFGGAGGGGTGSGTGGTSGGTTNAEGIPTVLAKNVEKITYDSTAQTLKVTLSGLDASDKEATYNRNAALDLNGYLAYDIQESSAQRRFVALVKESARGTVMASVVADGGQFNRYFGGGYYSRIDAYTIPTSGLATYIGSYAGVITLNDGSGGPQRTQGTVTLNADFTNSLVNGAVTNRSTTGGQALDTLVLTATSIDETGTFLGKVEFEDLTGVGDYGGLFGGTDASDVAGVLVVNPIGGDGTVWEHGAFVLPRCGTAGDAATCP
ncbi:hypothetical protein CLV77_1059 [Brevirhabdus pacifica]|nr:hypothetical protein [Brevirhabdus pacifica]PJJ86512.1 hypothetical protein CLV77_1059 [Brevirhabdus pacifica]